MKDLRSNSLRVCVIGEVIGAIYDTYTIITSRVDDKTFMKKLGANYVVFDETMQQMHPRQEDVVESCSENGSRSSEEADKSGGERE